MMSTEEMIRNSQCFGVAFDPTVSECKQCDVHLRCEHKCRMGKITMPIATMLANPLELLSYPDSPPAQPEEVTTKLVTPDNAKAKPKTESTNKIPKKTVKDAIKAKNYDPAMPEFKGLTMQQMEQMVVDRGGNLADFDKYKAENIRRMRLTMYLKKTYEI